MSYLARIFTNQASAEGATVTLFDRGSDQYLDPVYYDPYNSEGTYRTLYDYTEFGVELEAGYEFVQWVYRVGSETAAVQYSDNNPFVYRGMEYIVIRPEVQYTGGGQTVPVFIDFSTEEIERMRFYYYDGSGEEVSSGYIYGPEFLYVEANSWLSVRTLSLAEGALPPVYCTLPDGTQQLIVDENDNWFDRDLYVDDWGGTYWFRADSGGGGDGPDYGSFVERTVYINGQEYVPFISDGGSWYECKALIAE